MSFRIVEIIAAKRDGKPISKDAIDFLIQGFTAGTVPDYQVAAFLMAVLWRGMDADETAWLLDAMQRSGDFVTWEHLAQPTADKHSTGGVGDKVSIPLAPAVAACGVAVPMISGRGLGHTGGTLDKLESMPGPGGARRGFCVDYDLDGFRRLMDEVGVAMIGQTEAIVPADRKMYALRDVTATVESIPLIVASIMSKKLAEGAASLVLDVKVGSGAFMKTVADADTLARALVDAGQRCGRKVTAFLTAMERPLGTHIGNALEIRESIHLLRGEGPADTREVVCRLGGEMLRLSGAADNLEDGAARIARSLDDGSALAKFQQMVQAQGGDPAIGDDPDGVLWRVHKAPVVHTLTAWQPGRVQRMDALEIGLAAVRLGAGRNKSSDPVDPSVGFILAARPGDEVTEGAPLVEIHAASEDHAMRAAQQLRAAISIAEPGVPVTVPPLWLGRVGGEDLQSLPTV